MESFSSLAAPLLGVGEPGVGAAVRTIGSGVGRVASGVAASLTAPRRLDDYLGLANPLWSRRRLWGRVEAVQPETAGAATLVIRPGAGWRGHRAGQYVRLGIDIDGVWHWRAYSLSSPPGRPDGRISVTVRAIAGGRVSQHLVYRVAPGAAVRLEPARGDFVLAPAPPPRMLFLTAGSGITPVMSMLRGLALRGGMPDVVLVHSARTREEVIFGAELRGLAARFPSLRLHEHYTRTAAGGRPPGRFAMASLPAVCPDWPERPAWACGPPGLLAAAEANWREAGVADKLLVERFRPAVCGGGGGGGRVRFTASGREATAGGGVPLLVVGEDAGVLMPSGCRMGICRSCMARLGSGRVRDLRTGLEHGEEGEFVQTCISAAAGDVDIDL
jgi:ferredoxin-NADP reductase